MTIMMHPLNNLSILTRNPPIMQRQTGVFTTDQNLYTSSTAQGGCGSFKNRKPIGEIGCCEPGMAERSH